MKPFLLLSALWIVSVATGSEISDVEARIRETKYPMPLATIQRLHEIEKELTPSSKEKESEITKREEGYLCDTETVKVSYRLNDEAAPETFNATFTVPHRSAFARKYLPFTPYPAAVIQPTLAGPTGLETKIAWDLCVIGVASVVPDETVLDLPKVLPDFKAYDRNLQTEMVRARRLVDFLEGHKKIDRSKLGAIGFSRGSIAAALLVGIEPRIKFAFLGAGGLGNASIVAHTQTEKGTVDRERHMRAAKLNHEQFEAKLMETLEYDGLLFSHRIHSKKLKVMIVKNDFNVSTESQELLKKSFGDPETIYRDKGHVESIVRLVFFEMAEYQDFFRAQTK